MNSDSVSIVTLCGFLGSGKTTLLRHWPRDATLKDAPVIVEDLSEFGLDAKLLSDENSKPSLGRLIGGLAALHGSHAREQLHDSAGAVLKEIPTLDPAPPLVLCEITGAARPWPTPFLPLRSGPLAGPESSRQKKISSSKGDPNHVGLPDNPLSIAVFPENFGKIPTLRFQLSDIPDFGHRKGAPQGISRLHNDPQTDRSKSYNVRENTPWR